MKKTQKPKSKRDPFYQREKENYTIPLPSREFILQVLEEFGRPMSRQKLMTALEVEDPLEQETLGFRLKAMLRDGQIMQDRRGRFCLLKRINLKHGTIHAHPEGFGFFIPSDDSPDMRLSPKEMQGVMHGDIVLAFEVSVDRRGRPLGKIHEIIEHSNKTAVGRFFIEHGLGFVVPNNKHLTQDICIPLEFAGEAKHGQIVLVEIVAFPSKANQAIGKVIHVLGEHMAPGMEIEVAIYSYGLPFEWPEPVIAASQTISPQVQTKDHKGRQDLRSLPFVTIDGEDAKDFDDAVFCVQKPKGGFQLYVAIADVSHYVREGSVLDKEAAKRGNSVYFPGKVIPMLPEALSNGICSLNPHVDRLAVVAELAISAEGKIVRSKFYRAVFQSQARLTYSKVNQWLKAEEAPRGQEKIWPNLQALNQVYTALVKARKLRGAIDFEMTETYIQFDEQRKIKRIVPLIRNDAHRLIEECMLAANVAVARFLKKGKIPSLYRVHPPPDENKMETLRLFLKEFSLSLSGGKNPQAKDFQETLSRLHERPEKHLVETVMLRSLQQAIYTENNEGHFGLGFQAYTHFTSPIRRYPDLLVHRALIHLIEQQAVEGFSYQDKDMEQWGKHCSTTERRADEATRDVVTWLKCEYMQDKLGQSFEGRISSVTGFGVFVELSEVYVEGLVHITSLKNDYYHFDAIKHRLVGERTGKTYRLGDKMTVLVARVDLDERKIDFEPVLEEDSPDV